MLPRFLLAARQMLATLAVAAAVHAEPGAGEYSDLVDPWEAPASLAPTASADWIVPQVDDVGDPWQGTSPAADSDSLITDPWPEPSPSVATAAFPSAGLLDPWHLESDARCCGQ
jgi:hypothetical protein